MLILLLTISTFMIVVGQGVPRGEMVLCEGDNGRIECGPNERIYIYSAFYGRINKNICDYGEINTDKCLALYVTEKVKDTCDRRSFCTIYAVSDIFGDPCPGTYKYFRVRFVCDLEQGAAANRRLTTKANSSQLSSNGLSPTSPRLQFLQKYHDVSF